VILVNGPVIRKEHVQLSSPTMAAARARHFAVQACCVGTVCKRFVCRRDQQLLSQLLAHSLDQTERDLILDALRFVREAAVRRGAAGYQPAHPALQARRLREAGVDVPAA